MLPSLFLSHGAPTLPLMDSAATSFLRGLGASLERPKAILVASAHWETERPEVNAVAVNDTIHDFYGFPKALYEMTYPAPGDAALAQRVLGLPVRRAAESAWLTESLRGPEFSTAVGLLLFALNAPEHESAKNAGTRSGGILERLANLVGISS